MDTTTATAFVTDAKAAGHTITVMLHDATTPQTGDPISVNSKGVNLRIDGKVRAFNLKRVASIVVNAPAPEITDGMSTADVAEIFNMSAKELRVHLRKLGLGVGKGRKYGLAAADVDKLRESLNV